MSYLTNGTQYVSCNNSTSLPQNMTYSVSQGSILGPLLFILYINDLSFCLKQSKTILFANDTTIYISGNHITKLYNDMNKELQVLADWFHANNNRHIHSEQTSLKMSGEIIPPTHCVNFLGLIDD